MTLVLWAVGLLVASALAAGLLARDDARAFRVATAGTLAACAAGLVGAAAALATGEEATRRAGWALPTGAVTVGMDALSAFFLACALLVAGVAALHGLGSAPARAARAAGRGEPGPRLARAAAAYALTVAALATVALARDGVLFLGAWELMTLASWLLVTHHAERAEVRRAGMTYLIVSHAGGAALYVAFALLARHAGGWDLGAVTAAGPLPAGTAAAVFALAVVGFGAKAAFFPLHVWAPDAYPAAPPHAAALLSGALSKLGVYGLLRVVLLTGGARPGFGEALLAVGAVTAVAGALNAYTHRDLARLVAYSSVENLGVVALGVGVGLLGQAHGAPHVAWLGFAGALLHVLGHGVLKALLLLLAGDVVDATGARSLDRLGGLARRMPRTAALFAGGALTLAGLPPGVAFVSEWLLLSGALRAAATLPPGAAVVAVSAGAALALASGLAAAAWVKALGIGFLGWPRSTDGDAARDPGGAPRLATLGAAAVAVVLSLVPAAAATLPAPAVALLTGAAAPAGGLGPLAAVTALAWILLALAAGLAVLRARLLRRAEVRAAPVWGCGYEAPSPRMQYTAASFPDPALGVFTSLVERTVERDGPDGFFPARAAYAERRSDAAGDRLVVPLVRRLLGAVGRVRVLQAGRLQLYLLYVLATLIVLLVWQLVIAP